jgi:hypothetical protein
MEAIENECVAMAAKMLDEELLAIMRTVADEDEMTPLQQAVASELRNRRPAMPPPWKN